MYMAALNHVSGTDVTVEGQEDGGNASGHSMLQQELDIGQICHPVLIGCKGS